MSRIKGERFEYETRVLLEMKRHHIDFIEQKIETVYIEENASTHFRPVKDSIIIYGVILKYIIGSLLSFIIDMGLFTALQFILETYFQIGHNPCGNCRCKNNIVTV